MDGDSSTKETSKFENKIPYNLVDEYVKTKAAIKKERSEWLEKKVLFTALRSVLQDARLKRRQGDPNMFDEVEENILQTEVKYCGLNYDMQNETQNVDDETSKALASLIENKLLQTCKDVLEYHDGMYLVQHSQNQLQTARSIKLGEIIKAKTKRLEMCRHKFADAQNKEKQSYATCVKELLEACEYISKIVKKYAIELQPKRDEEKFTNLLSRCEALGLKSASMAVKLQKDLYTCDSIIALQSIRAELVKNKHTKHQETVAIEQQLQGFEGLGGDFIAIVNEYNQLQTDIEKRNWALNELQRR